MLRVNRTHTLHFILHITHSTLYTPYSTPDALNFALSTLHFTLHTSNSTVHIPHLYNTSHSTILTSHSTLYTLQSTLQTPHFTLYTSLHATLHFLYSTLHTPHSALPPTPHATVYTGTETGDACTRLLKYNPCIYIYFAKVLYVTAFGFVGLVFHGEIEEDEEAQPANARIFTSKVGYGM